VFTIEERKQVRDDLVSAAHADPRITGAALTGSAAVGRADRWSDIDLALCLDVDADYDQVIADWTERMYRDHGVVHYLDVWSGDTLFRVFLLADTLQIDLAFWHAADFGATASTFRLLFGTANERPRTKPPTAAHLIGWSWLYALHARSSIARGRVWQAEYMVSGMRDQVLALACLRHGVPTTEGRGMDDLPPEDTAPLLAALPQSLEIGALNRAFRVTTEALLRETDQVDPELARILAEPLRELAKGPHES
jgi:predicted nucleotidyltransferase